MYRNNTMYLYSTVIILRWVRVTEICLSFHSGRGWEGSNSLVWKLHRWARTWHGQAVSILQGREGLYLDSVKKLIKLIRCKWKGSCLCGSSWKWSVRKREMLLYEKRDIEMYQVQTTSVFYFLLSIQKM